MFPPGPITVTITSYISLGSNSSMVMLKLVSVILSSVVLTQSVVEGNLTHTSTPVMGPPV